MRSYNIQFPLNDDTEYNNLFKMNYVSKESYSSNLLLLLLTEKGERYYEPEYGCNLIKFLHEPYDDITFTDIERSIKETVSKYIPNLKIVSVEFNTYEENNNDVDSPHQVNIKIKFIYDEKVYNEVGELEINI